MSLSTLVITIKVGSAEGRQIQLKNGTKKNVAEQVGFVEMDEEVRKVRVPINVDEGQVPYPPGRYTLAAVSFTVGKFHDLQVNPYEIALVPLSAVGVAPVRNAG